MTLTGLVLAGAAFGYATNVGGADPPPPSPSAPPAWAVAARRSPDAVVLWFVGPDARPLPGLLIEPEGGGAAWRSSAEGLVVLGPSAPNALRVIEQRDDDDSDDDEPPPGEEDDAAEPDHADRQVRLSLTLPPTPAPLRPPIWLWPRHPGAAPGGVWEGVGLVAPENVASMPSLGARTKPGGLPWMTLRGGKTAPLAAQIVGPAGDGVFTWRVALPVAAALGPYEVLIANEPIGVVEVAPAAHGAPLALQTESHWEPWVPARIEARADTALGPLRWRVTATRVRTPPLGVFGFHFGSADDGPRLDETLERPGKSDVERLTWVPAPPEAGRWLYRVEAHAAGGRASVDAECRRGLELGVRVDPTPDGGADVAVIAVRAGAALGGSELVAGVRVRVTAADASTAYLPSGAGCEMITASIPRSCHLSAHAGATPRVLAASENPEVAAAAYDWRPPGEWQVRPEAIIDHPGAHRVEWTSGTSLWPMRDDETRREANETVWVTAATDNLKAAAVAPPAPRRILVRGPAHLTAVVARASGGAVRLAAFDELVPAGLSALGVELSAQPTPARPGQPVTALVRVKDRRGRPVKGARVVFAALRGRAGITPLSPEHIALRLRVPDQPFTTWRADGPSWKRMAPIDRPGEPPPIVHPAPPAIAWSTALRTDGRGEARMGFSADEGELTLQALALADDLRLGSASASLTVQAPLAVQVPDRRTWPAGERRVVPVWIENRDPVAHEATVSAETMGLRWLEGSPYEELTLPAHGGVLLAWPLQANPQAPAAELLVRVSHADGEIRQAVRWQLTP